MQLLYNSRWTVIDLAKQALALLPQFPGLGFITVVVTRRPEDIEEGIGLNKEQFFYHMIAVAGMTSVGTAVAVIRVIKDDENKDVPINIKVGVMKPGRELVKAYFELIPAD